MKMTSHKRARSEWMWICSTRNTRESRSPSGVIDLHNLRTASWLESFSWLMVRDDGARCDERRRFAAFEVEPSVQTASANSINHHQKGSGLSSLTCYAFRR